MKFEEGVGCGFLLLWTAGALAVAGFWGVVIWAIIKLVHHVAG